MNPFVNLDDLDTFEEHHKGPYQEKCASVSSLIGAKKLSYSISVVPPGGNLSTTPSPGVPIRLN